MDYTSIKKDILKIASEELKIPENDIPLKSSLVMDLGIDSLAMVELIMAVENKFSLSFSDSASSRLDTLDDLINETTKLLN